MEIDGVEPEKIICSLHAWTELSKSNWRVVEKDTV